MAKELMPTPVIEQAARRFKVLSEPVRLELLNLLHMHGELNVQELVGRTGYQQANVSKHLLMLAQEGILHRRKEGLNVFYRIEDPTLAGLCVLVCSHLR